MRWMTICNTCAPDPTVPGSNIIIHRCFCTPTTPKEKAIGSLQLTFTQQKTLARLNEGWDCEKEMKDVEVHQMKGYHSVRHITLRHKLKEREEKVSRGRWRNPIRTGKILRSSVTFSVDAVVLRLTVSHRC